MPTNRKRRKHHRLAPANVPEAVWAWATDQDWHQLDGKLILFTEDRATLWLTHRDAVIEYWCRMYPGTRPTNFWLYEVRPPKTKAEAAEEQVDYLRRNRLLTAHERKVLRKNSK